MSFRAKPRTVETPVDPSRGEALLDDLLRKAQDYMNRAVSGRANASSSASNRRRLTEKEEDSILLEDEAHSEDEGSDVSFLREQPTNVTGKMRAYQLEGLNWMIRLWKAGVSGILADEMGLGKTLQSISLLAYLRLYQHIPGPHLILTPLSTLGNWERELHRWCPDIRVFKFHGAKQERMDWIREGKLDSSNFDVLLTSYEMAVSEKSALKKSKWECLIIDEAHRIKDENSLLSQVVRFFDSKFRLLLTGTPLQNNLHELWALLNFLLPELFSSAAEFDAMFIDADTESNKGQSLLQQLHRLLRPFMLRRLKAQVETELLPKKETVLFVSMTAKQTELYKSILIGDIEAVLGKVKERSRLMNIVMQLRKCANHAYLFEGAEDPNAPPYGEHLIENSGKMVVLDKLLKYLFARGSRVLVFSQMTRTLDIIDDYAQYRGFKYCRIDGNTAQDRREEMMKEFNAEGSEKQLFLLSTRAGGLGINLYTADIVILFDSDWNPQMDLQAMDRAHRIGQKKQVMVYRLVTEGTIEEKILERAEIKLRLDAMVVQAGKVQSKKSHGLSNDDVASMIRFGADRIIRSTGGNVTDEDIVAILERGEQKTAEISNKLKNHLTHFDLSFDGAPLLPQEEHGEIDVADKNLQIIMSMSDSLGKRERKVNYDVNQYYREALAVGKQKSLLMKPFRIPAMRDFQLFDQDRIYELSRKELKFYEQHQWDINPPKLCGLDEKERAEMEKLLSEGFSDWGFNDFAVYVKALKRFGRYNTEKLVEAMKKHKNREEVLKYHEHFTTKAHILKGKWLNLMHKIELAEKRLQQNSQYESIIEELLRPYRTRAELLAELQIVYTNNNRDDKGFTESTDKLLLSLVHQFGYGNWKKITKHLKMQAKFNFDYLILSKNWADIKRRTEILLREIVRHRKRKEKGKKGSDAEAEGEQEAEGEGAADSTKKRGRKKAAADSATSGGRGKKRAAGAKEEGKDKSRERSTKRVKESPANANGDD